MTNSIVWDLKKSWNEKGTHFCYKIHEKNSSNRNATGYKWVLVTCWAGIILLKSRIAIRVIVDNLRRENQLYLWLFVKMFWLYLGVIDSQSSSSAWVLSRASSPRVNKKRVKATLTPLVHLSLAIPASVLVGSCDIFPSNFFKDLK